MASPHPSHITVRDAGPDDAPEVYRLIRELAVYEKLDDEVRATEDDLRRAMEADDPRLHVLLAEQAGAGPNDDGGDADTEYHATGSASAPAGPAPDGGPEPVDPPLRAVGFALYFFTFSTFEGRPSLYLEDVYVEPEARGYGIGTAILRRLAARARAHGCRRMEWTALDWNTSARTFYENLDARPMSSWVIYRLEESGIAALAESVGPQIAPHARGAQRNRFTSS